MLTRFVSIKYCKKLLILLGVQLLLFATKPLNAFDYADLANKRKTVLASLDNPKAMETLLFEYILTQDHEIDPLSWVRASWTFGVLASDGALDLHLKREIDIIPYLERAKHVAARENLYDEMIDIIYSIRMIGTGEFDPQFFQSLIAIADKQQIWVAKARILSIFALYYLNVGEVKKGTVAMHEAIKIMEDYEFQDFEQLIIKNYLALGFYNLDQNEHAIRLLQDVDWQAKNLKLRWIRMPILHNIGKAIIRQGENDLSAKKAQPFFESQHKLAMELGMNWDEALSLLNLAELEIYFGQWEQAILKAHQSIVKFAAIGENRRLAEAYGIIAEAEIARENWQAALQANTKAFEYAPAKLKRIGMRLEHNFYQIYKGMGHYQQSLEHLESYSSDFKLLATEREKDIISKKTVSMGLALEQERNRMQALELANQKHLNQLKSFAVILLACSVILAFVAFLRIRLKNQKIEALNSFIRTHVLERFLPHELVQEISEGRTRLNEEAEKCEVTVLFADLCSFTRATEHLGAEKISIILNRFLENMTAIIFCYGGTIDKFIGDGIMVIFGAPTPLSAEEQARRAVLCACDMRQELFRLNEYWEDEFEWSFQMRIGIHQGTSIVGSFGSEKRSDYTVVGNAVNIASRIEAEAMPDQILITETVARHMSTEKLQIEGARRLRGIEHEMILYSVQPDKALQKAG